MKKTMIAAIMAVTMVLSSSVVAFAGQWQQEGTIWKYQNDNGNYATNGWQWIDGDSDGVAECYYFDVNGIMLANTTTPDGYQVDASGAWIVNGVVQTQTSAVNNGNSNNTEVASGYSADGISNVAIDLLHLTRDEANIKYGPEEVSPYSATPSIKYPTTPFGVGWSIKSGHEQAWEQNPEDMNNL